MKLTAAIVTVILAKATAILAHGGVTSWTAGGKTFQGWQPFLQGAHIWTTIKCSLLIVVFSYWTGYSRSTLPQLRPHSQRRRPNNPLQQ